jgi:hypothetical protein
MEIIREKIYKIQNKSVQALLLGYVVFKVNGKLFLNYTKARNYRLVLAAGTKENINFNGWNIFQTTWKCFFKRVSF